ncbi:DUF2309 domain-containing protein [Cryomorpha ignava]|uniref:Probable inorganic carbon transporter subunit DabA n=1 Tax=Cryomorpha ignava TaxID=101383 RepID=A0A7K3WN39_9FLAO|nr:DUF2309 domain-containing protein [Cryomorpha ignava]NEN22411.1 DUF2309 domain-containing protein [Cryomorpha ignava]
MVENSLRNAGYFENLSDEQAKLLSTLRTACKKIAPVWPLENFVAVNPYLGLTDKKFTEVAQELAYAGAIQMTLPGGFYLEKIKAGKITNDDIAAALRRRNSKIEVKDFIQKINKRPEKPIKIKTIPIIAESAAQVTHKDWSRLVIARISVWAASYFDNGQAIWSAANKNKGLFMAWKAEAEIDRTPEISGLKNFRKHIKQLPDHPLYAAQVALDKIGIPEEGIPLYLHKILLGVGGWSAYAARLDWDSELYGGKDGKLIEFLAILLCWEACILDSLMHTSLSQKWNENKALYGQVNIQVEIQEQLSENLILQEAFDIAAQRKLISKFKSQNYINDKSVRPKAQAVFCIDVRSEVYRRNLEAVNAKIETLGFAGFFAFSINYLPIGHKVGEAQCPVLLKTGPNILEQMPDEKEQKGVFNNRILSRQIQQVWKTFKSGAITCFSFVSPLGLTYLPKLFTDSFGITRPVPNPNKTGMTNNTSSKKSISLKSEIVDGKSFGIPIDQQIEMAKNALIAMSLAENFAPFVLITGHGSTMVNNPHASGYDCGACGGHTGEANAKVAAAVLNNNEVREGLKKANIFIPKDTTFLACLHDTTTDEVGIYNENDVPINQKEALAEIKKSLRLAGNATRLERSLKLSPTGNDVSKSIIARSKDWSQVRPEWGLAGCSAFVVAPRSRSKHIDLGSSTFLHSYNWKRDTQFSVLELIMTAPMVVTAWINLQYYGSTVDNKTFGSGNKTLHNVTAGIGVLEGYSGDLRVGLPIQSIHDGERYQHEPLRLNVIVEAPMAEMNRIIEKHQMVKELCDNGWINLLAMNEEGMVSHRYTGNLSWERLNAVSSTN